MSEKEPLAKPKPTNPVCFTKKTKINNFSIVLQRRKISVKHSKSFGSSQNLETCPMNASLIEQIE